MGKRNKKSCSVYILSCMLFLFCLVLIAIGFTGKSHAVISRFQEQFQKEEIPYQTTDEISREELDGKYYYQQLGADEKTVYREILQGVQENIEEIYVHASDAKKTNTLFQYVMKDYPEIFWCNGTTTSTVYKGEEGETYTVLEPVYLYDSERRKVMEQEIRDAAEQCIAEVQETAGDYEKILYVYDYIVNLVEYDQEASDNQNIYSVLVNHRSVCAGYSKATQYLLERMGVFCTYVTGKTTDGQSHAWNLVKCNGDYYYVDTTWGDPVFQESEGDSESDQNHISYDYMCCDEEELFRTHIPDSDILFPSCTKMDYNYYVVNGMYYREYNSEEILKSMNETIWAGENPTVLKFSDHDVYAKAHDDIFQNLIKTAARNLADYYQMSEVKYQYLDDPDLNKITIYWRYR